MKKRTAAPNRLLFSRITDGKRILKRPNKKKTALTYKGQPVENDLHPIIKS